VRVAFPMKKLVNLICMLTNSAAKIPMVRLLEQVYNTEFNTLHVRTKLKMLRSFSDSIEGVAKNLDESVGRQHKSVTNRSTALNSTATPKDYAYVFEVVLPFLVGYYHASFRHSAASPEEIVVSNEIFDNAVSLSRAALDNIQGRAAGILVNTSTISKKLLGHGRQSLLINVGSTVNVSLSSLENATNCLMHMADPTGSGIFRDSDEGVLGSQNREEFLALFRKLQAALSAEHDRRRAREEEEAAAAKSKTHHEDETPMRRWVMKNRKHFVAGGEKEIKDFFKLLETQKENERFLRKIILLIGEFATDENMTIIKGGRKLTGFSWIDENASEFATAYVQTLHHLIDVDPDDSTKELLISIGLCRILIHLMSRSSSLRVKKAVFHLGNAVLSAGLKTQEAFRNEYYNQASNEFFIRMRDLLATPLRIRSKQELITYGTTQTPERFGSWELQALILRFCQCACEGHNYNWQMLLHHQTLGGSGKDDFLSGAQLQVGISVSIINSLSDMVARLVYSHGPLWYVLVYWDRWYDYEVINQVLLLATKLFNTIIEVQQGPCHANQVELAHGRFIDSLNWLLDSCVTAEVSKTKKIVGGGQFGTWTQKDENNAEDETPDRQESLLAVQGLAVTALNSMLEGDVDQSIPKRILSLFNFSLIEQLMTIYLGVFDAASSDQEEPDLDDKYAVACIDYYIFTRNLISRWNSSGCTGPYSVSFAAFLKSAVYTKCYARFQPLMASCEFLRDGRLEEVLFRLPGIVQIQSQTATFKNSCVATVYSVNRENQPSKLADFVRQSNQLVYELTSFPEWKKSWLVRRAPFFQNATFYLSIILNIFAMIPSFSNSNGDDVTFWHFTRPEALLNWLFGILLIILALGRIIAFTTAQIPTSMFEYTNGDPDWFFRKQDGDNEHETRIKTIWRFVPFGFWFFLQPFTMYQFVYVAFSIIALRTHAFYAYHLFDIVGRSDQLREVFASLAKYASTLGLTALLWVILVYGFVVWGYLGFADDFRSTGGTGNMGVPGNDNFPDAGNCDSPWQCFFFHLVWSIRQGGGIGDSLIPVGEFWENPLRFNLVHYYFRVVYDLAFFIVCNVIMIAIVTGIIIDAFGAARDNRKEVEEDQAAKCFVCGIEGSRFEVKRPKDKNDTRKYGFSHHRNNEHNEWNYIYFFAHLFLKDPNEYTGSETYVANLLKDRSIDFFPIERSIMLEA